MNRDYVKKAFEEMGSRITIRTGLSTSSTRPIALNVTKDSKGEHFTMTLHPNLDENKTIIQVMDIDKKHRQMLLNIIYWTFPPEIRPLRRREKEKNWRTPGLDPQRKFKEQKIIERLLVGHDEMHWFVAGVTASKTIKEAFFMLRPEAVTLAARRSGVKNKDVFRHKTKGFIRQGEWFFVPAHIEDKNLVIHKNEPISRQGGTPHIVEELIRYGGERVYINFKNNSNMISEKEYNRLIKDSPSEAKNFQLRMRNAKVFGRGKVKHRDHHTIELKGWHEIHLSTEKNMSGGMNAFID